MIFKNQKAYGIFVCGYIIFCRHPHPPHPPLLLFVTNLWYYWWVFYFVCLSVNTFNPYWTHFLFFWKYENYLFTITAISYSILKDVKNLLVFDLMINFDIFSPRANISAMKKTLLTYLLFACFSRTILKSQPWDRFLLKINIQKM